MASVNLAILIGVVGQDAEIKNTRTGDTMASVSIATDSYYTDSKGHNHNRTDWHRVILWGSIADRMAPYLKKGQQVYVEGSIHTRVFRTEDNDKKAVTEIKASRIIPLETSDNQAGVDGNRTRRV